MSGHTFALLLLLPIICELKLLLDDEKEKHDVTKLLDHLVDEANYDKTLRPNFAGDPVKVGITVNVDSLGPIDEVNMNFRVDISFRQYWKDSRLSFDNYAKDGKVLPPDLPASLTLSHKVLDRIWVPDTYFPDSLTAFKQDVMVPNILLRLYPDGNLLYSMRTTIISKCQLILDNFPMDKQICKMMIECYGYTTEDLVLFWLNGTSSVDLTPMQLSQFVLADFRVNNYTLTFSTGNFSDLDVTFLFQRDLLYFITQSYIPSTVIVLCSWVAFWINREGIPGRACLSITTVLSIITLIGSTNSKLPNVSCVKALDVYFGLCFVYVFGGLLEFATVIYLSTEEKKQKREKQAQEEKVKKYLADINTSKENAFLADLESSFCSAANSREGSRRNSFSVGIMPGLSTLPMRDQASQLLQEFRGFAEAQLSTQSEKSAGEMKELKKKRITASKIEVYSRIFFPTSFLILEMIYWVTYKIKSQTVEGWEEE